MTVAAAPLAEITATAIRVLCREIGAVNTARFLNQFTIGCGDYTKERRQMLGEPTVDELVDEILKQRASTTRAKKAVPKTARRTQRRAT